MTQTTPPKKSDLGVRAGSAVVMVAVAGTALWLGSWVWTAFVALVALGVLWEWWGLVRKFEGKPAAIVIWMAIGLFYVGVAAACLVALSVPDSGYAPAIVVIGSVVATDIGAYFAGRSIGGPKIAPSISPSKTWAGLGGGIVGSACVWIGYALWEYQSEIEEIARHGLQMSPSFEWIFAIGLGAGVAVAAQAGDFFESWMKRRAGTKDSGTLLPGHGGLFDRADGLIGVLFVTGAVEFLTKL